MNNGVAQDWLLFELVGHESSLVVVRHDVDVSDVIDCCITVPVAVVRDSVFSGVENGCFHVAWKSDHVDYRVVRVRRGTPELEACLLPVQAEETTALLVESGPVYGAAVWWVELEELFFSAWV